MKSCTLPPAAIGTIEIVLWFARRPQKRVSEAAFLTATNNAANRQFRDRAAVRAALRQLAAAGILGTEDIGGKGRSKHIYFWWAGISSLPVLTSALLVGRYEMPALTAALDKLQPKGNHHDE